MKGDFTRDSFDPLKHFSRVFMQQGRVTLDADYNEQTAILLHYLRTLARDLIGPFAIPGPPDGGFALSASEDGHDILVSPGRCYVDGILVENGRPDASFLQQPYAPGDPLDFGGFLEGGGMVDKPFLLYLDVWERHVTWIEDDHIRDVALGGPDTCTRAQIVWQLKAGTASDVDFPRTTEDIHQACELSLLELLDVEAKRHLAATLTARVEPAGKSISACITAPESRYRGLENQLYRVEIHQDSDPGSHAFSFKWSRDNGSIASRIVGLAANQIEVVNSRGFEPDIWVEISFDDQELQGQPGWMVKLMKIEGNRLYADPETIPNGMPGSWKEAYSLRHPKVRRWDQAASESLPLVDGVIEVTPAQVDQWIDLEDGIEVRFAADAPYRSGDYWLIPARVASGRIEWPEAMEETGEMVAQPVPAHGIEHHYAPLGFVGREAEGGLGIAQCVCTLPPLAVCTGLLVERVERVGRAAPRPKKPAKPTP